MIEIINDMYYLYSMGYTHIINQLHEALEDTYKVTRQWWFDNNWNGVNTIIKVMNIELTSILDIYYEAYIKSVEGFSEDKRLKTYNIAIKDPHGHDIIVGHIYCHGLGDADIWSKYALTCFLDNVEE